jgi:hypothetical protein
MKPAALHVTDGESVAGTLRESGLRGEVVTDGDLLYQGPPRPPSSALARFVDHYETMLWFDHRLSNQLLLIRALDWFSRQNLTGHRLSIVFAGRTILGSRTASQLAALARSRVPADPARLEVAREAWTAFASQDPAAIERVLATDTSALPCLAEALRRYLEDLPAQDGLTRTQRQALVVLREHGPLPRQRLFFAVQGLEETPFMGDQCFYNVLAGLASAREPLIQGRSQSGSVAITDAGVRLLGSP